MKLDALSVSAVKSVSNIEKAVRVSRSSISTAAGMHVQTGIKAGAYLGIYAASYSG